METERFEQSLRDDNEERLMRLLPFILGASFLMLLVSFWIDDLLEVKWINGFLFTYCLIAFLGIQLGVVEREEKRIRLFQNMTVCCLLIWGTLMMGYKPESVISYFDFVIVFVVTGAVIQMKWQYWLIYFVVDFCGLIFMTPFLKRVDENIIVILVSVSIFYAMILYMNYLFYNQSMSNYRINCKLYEHQQELEKKVNEKTEALLNSERSMVKEVALLLATVLEYYDEYTKGHSESVALIAVSLAKALGFDLARQNEIYWAGLIHDIGKIHINKELLNKPARLNREEYEIIKGHTNHGYEMTKNAETLKEIAIIIKHHHEKFDGTGYPNGLKGDEIPLASQIIAIADAWDVMRSDRTYRRALTLENARLELIKNSGTQFSPQLVAVFLDLECARPD
ncbi:HD-GYP domain-containing protein [Fusibacter ferrireducens]|uniref:HD-GYP domain-containing protein n=1 Tax=Fusibacter ferrireducens TaxID=2785058 RepID=A0ABR9ZVJ8_9FIRM|nr:HD domain-containing phosphohydrolase [Fusibacter ferrireducens]MBF4694472.1 HD-GYP domain-containing protein [Fusibacter ferrireducens]